MGQKRSPDTAALRTALETTITERRAADAARLAAILAGGVRAVSDSKVLPSEARRRH